MRKPSEPDESWDTLRDKIIGLGEASIRKSYYPELQQRLAELERFRVLLDQSNDAIFLIRLPDGQVADVNESACQQLGYTRDELLDQPIDQLTSTDLMPWLSTQPTSAAGARLDRETFVTGLRRRDGETLPVEVTARRAAFQGADYAVSVARDITERRQAEATLRESEQKFRSIIEQSLDGIVLLDADGQITEWNTGEEQITGLTRADAIGRRLWDVEQRLSPTGSPPIDDRARVVIREMLLPESTARREFRQEVAIQRLDGERRIVHIAAFPIKTSAGYMIGSITRDMTELHRAEEERQAHLRFLESMDQINRAMQSTHDLEKMMSDVLDGVLAIFDCDRAFLMYPCDPEAATWQVPMERTRPEYPGVLPLGVDLPMDPVGAAVYRILRNSAGPAQFSPGTEHSLPADVADRFGFKSFMAMVVYPRVDKPWQFGIHQCSYPRIWTPEEERLFQEIGRRLSDTLTSLLVYRDLRASENRYRLLAENATDIIFTMSLDLRFTYISPSVTRMRGYAVEEAMAQTIDEILTPASLNLAMNTFREVLENEAREPRQPAQTRTLALEERCKDGSTVWTETTFTFLRNGQDQLSGLLGITRDITERTRAEREIIRLNRLYAVLSDINQAIVRTRDQQQLFDEACRVAVEVGRFGLAWIGRVNVRTQMLEILARYGDSLGHFEYLPVSLSKHISDSSDPSVTAIRDGRVCVSNDIKHDTPPAAWREVALRRGYRSLAVLPLMVSGQIWGAIHFYSAEPAFFDERELRLLEKLAADLTYAVESLQRDEQRKQAEEALRQSQKLESLGVLAGGVAHDFNNLLVAMLGQTSLALEQLPTDSAPRAHIEKAVGAARRAADLTRQLLAYSGRGQFQILPVNLNTLIQENLHLFEVAIPKNVHLVSDLAESLPVIEGDVGQMQQIVMNLIINAAEAIGRNPGTVRVTTDTYYITPADVQVWKYVGSPLTSGLYTTLSVRDNGAGMDTATLSRVFDPFFTTKITGRGLGLAAVLGIVRSHKGGLRVESEPGTGTAFTLYFPVSAAQPMTPTRVEPEPGAAVTQGLVLVIDDEESVREAATDILESVGLTVITAADGQAGLALYRERQADIRLVVLDLSMPGLSGEETLIELQRVNSPVAIILSSGYQQTEVTHRFASQRSVGFLQKPYDMTTLIQAVQQYLAA
jgi:PAS domain S-box-containing protein